MFEEHRKSNRLREAVDPDEEHEEPVRMSRPTCPIDRFSVECKVENDNDRESFLSNLQKEKKIKSKKLQKMTFYHRFEVERRSTLEFER